MKWASSIKALMPLLLMVGQTVHAKRAAEPSIPFSSIASSEAEQAWNDQKAILAEARKHFPSPPPTDPKALREYYLKVRAWGDAHDLALLAKHKAAYQVDIMPARIGGVGVEIFTPVAGIPEANADRVLINLHAGGFMVGARYGGQIESIPISAVAGIKVISIDYRQAPEFHFPAATDDVLAVYRELLKRYLPGNIGIYGCSAGGMLTAEAVVAILAAKMPRPGAIGMFCGSGEVWAKGDSATFFALLNGMPPTWHQNLHDFEYFRGADIENPLVLPMRHVDQLRAFPPSLLISGTRSHDMSTSIDANNKLVAAGVDSKVQVWDGVAHAFLRDPSLPESRQAYAVIAKFFNEKLGPWYRESLQRFLAADLTMRPERCGVLFTGSSSIVGWDSLSQDMAPAKVLNRGFGGSTIAEINDAFDYVITPYWPKAIFFYAGENDLSAGKGPAEVLAAFKQFMEMKTRRLQDAPVYFISIKPSKLRLDELAVQQEANRLIKTYAAGRNDLHYIDVATAMMDHGAIRDIFKADNLHMRSEGYRIWADIIRPLVVHEDNRPAPRCDAMHPRDQRAIAP